VITSLQKRGRRLQSVSILPGGFMPLRGEDIEALPQSMRFLSITDVTGDTPKPVRSLGGAALVRLPQAAKRRLLTISLEEPRRASLGIRASADALLLYLSISLPADRVVSVLPEWGIGLIGRDGRSFAFVWGRGTISSLAAHGDDRAERDLGAAIQQWADVGRPGPDQLLVTVDYAEATPRLRSRWRVGEPG
jgi:hypothetical protein